MGTRGPRGKKMPLRKVSARRVGGWPGEEGGVAKRVGEKKAVPGSTFNNFGQWAMVALPMLLRVSGRQKMGKTNPTEISSNSYENIL